MATIIDEIVHNRKKLIEKEKQVLGPEELISAVEKKLASGYVPAPFLSRKDAEPFLIAEIKKASPSKGLIRSDFDVTSIAACYESSPYVRAVSVLTEPEYFKGGYENLSIASAHTSRPLLMKDFIVDAYQVMRGYLSGASAFLVISSITDDRAMDEFSSLAARLGMAILFEAHSAAEYGRAIGLGTELVGINNRDLATFSTSVDHTLRLVEEQGLPGSSLLVSESGIASYDDVRRLGSAGVGGFLVGETFMRQADIEAAIELLMTGRG